MIQLALLRSIMAFFYTIVNYMLIFLPDSEQTDTTEGFGLGSRRRLSNFLEALEAFGEIENLEES